MSDEFDVIVVGARCAGAPTAMLLARRGWRVLLVDRASFPSDTVSTHVIHAPGVAALERWGLRQAVTETGCPPFRRYAFDFGPVTIAGAPRPIDGVGDALCPRRTVLDEILVKAAADAGADVRESFTVDRLLIDDGTVRGITGHSAGGGTITARASVVVGADGRNSLVAKAVRPEQYHQKPAVSPAFYSYWSGVGSSGFEVFGRERCGMAAFPTHDELTLLIVGMPEEDFTAARADVEGAFLRAIDQAPAFAERVRSGERVERFRAVSGLAGYFRKPYGPGWALVGDAGYRLHPITAQGITDAFLDAERLSEALDAAFTGRDTHGDAMAAYRRRRDEHAMPMYEMTFELAQLEEPPPPEMQALFEAISGSQPAMDDFVSVQAGTLPVAEFFDPANIGRLMAGATDSAEVV